jgi:hypothetical protein
VVLAGFDQPEVIVVQRPPAIMHVRGNENESRWIRVDASLCPRDMREESTSMISKRMK